MSRWSGAIADEGDDVSVLRVHRRLAVGRAIDFDLGEGVALEALDQDQVDRLEQAQEFGERRLRRPAQFPHQREPIGRRDQHFVRLGGAMLVRILAWPVDVEAVMGVLDRGHAQATPAKFGNEPDDERGLARSAPAGEADRAHAPQPLLPSAPAFGYLAVRPKKQKKKREEKGP